MNVHHGAKLSVGVTNLDILTSGTTTVGDSSTDGSEYVLIGRSPDDKPILQFIGGIGATKTYTEHGILATYATVDVGSSATLDVTNDLLVTAGTFDLDEESGSSFVFDGNGLIDGGGTLVAGAPLRDATFTLNGTVTVGAHGSNVLASVGVATLTGTGTIRQVGQNDTTAVGEVTAGVHLDIQAGELTYSNLFGHLDGTIGPVSGSGPSLGPSAVVAFFPAFFSPQLQSAKFDTSAGILSLLGATGQDIADFHFAGDASGLNVSRILVQSGNSTEIAITDHPGLASPIPISFR